MYRHDAGVLELGGAAGLAQEAVKVFRPGNAAGAGNLDGHQPVQLRVACLVDRAERADAKLFEKLELTQTAGRLGRQPGAGSARIELDAGAAAGANDRFRGGTARRQSTMAMRADKFHGGNSAEANGIGVHCLPSARRFQQIFSQESQFGLGVKSSTKSES